MRGDQRIAGGTHRRQAAVSGPDRSGVRVFQVFQHGGGVGDAGQHVVAQFLDDLAGGLARLLAAFQQPGDDGATVHAGAIAPVAIAAVA